MAGSPALGRGERAPDFVLPAADGTPTRYYAKAGGRPAVLIVTSGGPAGPGAALAAALCDRLPGQQVGPDGHDAPATATVHLVRGAAPDGGGEPDGGGAPDGGGEVPTFVDAQAKAAGAFRTGGRPTAFVLDPNLRVRAAVALGDDAAAALGQVEAALATLVPAGEAREIRAGAPVLLVPDVLDQAQCQDLITLWADRGNVATGVEQSAEGRRREQLTAHLKRRRDHTVTDPDRSRQLATILGRRLMPELAKAFAYRATRFEGFKIVCYDAADGGWFRAHRDNLSPATAHRRFALTLNLNDDYEGGHLRFPEYSQDRYRPPAGGALLFSCQHLHEVLDVTAGRRFVLLSFLFGEEGRRPAPRPAAASTADH